MDMATKASTKEIRKFEGEFPLIIATVNGRTVAGVQRSEAQDGSWTICSGLTGVELPVIRARNEEAAVKWLHFLADLYEGKVK